MSDVRMFYVEDDIKKIQTKPNLYILKFGPAGAAHLFREVGQNAVDECTDPESPGSHITITYDKATDIIRCEDDGRGFPEIDYPLEIFCTKIQSGSKFFRDQGGNSSGEFGVGITVTNALSDLFELTSFRSKENTQHRIKFLCGEKVLDETKPLGAKKHGSIISFKPSKKFLGANTVIPYKEIIDWISRISYQFGDNKLKINFDVYDGIELIEAHTFKSKPFSNLLDKITPVNDFTSKCSFSGDGYIIEHVRKTKIDKNGNIEVDDEATDIKKNVHVDVALRYTGENITFFDSYCNYTNTTDGGVHQDVVERCFCNYIQNKAKSSMSDSQREKLPIIWDDVRSGLCCVINLSTNAQVGFVGNAKTKIGNENLIPVITEIVNKGLDDFFHQHPSVLNEYIKTVKINARARIDMLKAKIASQKEKMNSFKEHEMKNYIPCTNKGKQWKEIFLVEGDSPGGSARNGCDTRTQAFFLFRGIVANAFKCNASQIMQNNEWKDLVTVLRCGFGASFDLSKLYFKRINILTDQDVDGFYISSGMLAFFYKFLPEIIKAGLLYKVFTPLYALEDKEHPFVANKAEMVKIYHKKITKNYKIKFDGCEEYASKDDIQEFLTDAYDYRENLIRAAKDMGRINKFFVEALIAYMTLGNVVRSETDFDDLQKTFDDPKFVKYIMSRLQERWSELELTPSERIKGIVDGRFCLVKVNRRFIRKTSSLIPIYQKYGYKFTIQEQDKDPVIMTIGEFLDNSTKYLPKIKERFKGLGELDGDELFSTALDINNRVSVQYTMTSAKEELEVFKKVHGSSKKDLVSRKKMMSEYKINRDDLDN